MSRLARAREHLWRLWPRRPFGPLLPLLPFLGYGLYAFARHDLRFDHFAIVAIVATLAWIGPRTKELLVGIYPIGLVFLVYDGMRPFQKVGLTAERVLLCDLRSFEARFFGFGGSTLHDWFQVHHTLGLDLFCAIPYATFILWCIGGAIYLYVRDRPAMRRFMWGFLAMNVAGFVTYHLLPAAPPWYFHSHGCTVDLATKASEGPALARVDAFLGIGYFHGMYGKASSVFGALPSLHCAYPFLLLLEGWRAFGPKLRAAAVTYWAIMVFSAIYLDHHWVVDAILGTTYATVVALAMRLLERRRREDRALDVQQELAT